MQPHMEAEALLKFVSFYCAFIVTCMFGVHLYIVYLCMSCGKKKMRAWVQHYKFFVLLAEGEVKYGECKFSNCNM
jgi:hypothetical protein